MSGYPWWVRGELPPDERADAMRILDCVRQLNHHVVMARLENLLEAAAMLKKAGMADLAFVLAGDPQGRDSYVRELDAMIASLGLDGTVRRVGHCTDMPAALLAASVVAVPSTEPEAFGRSAVPQRNRASRPRRPSEHAPDVLRQRLDLHELVRSERDGDRPLRILAQRQARNS